MTWFITFTSDIKIVMYSHLWEAVDKHHMGLVSCRKFPEKHEQELMVEEVLMTHLETDAQLNESFSYIHKTTKLTFSDSSNSSHPSRSVTSHGDWTFSSHWWCRSWTRSWLCHHHYMTMVKKIIDRAELTLTYNKPVTCHLSWELPTFLSRTKLIKLD